MPLPKSSVNKEDTVDTLSPALLLATQWYVPMSSTLVPVNKSWLRTVLLSNKITFSSTLGLVCKAYGSSFFTQEMVGLG